MTSPSLPLTAIVLAGGRSRRMGRPKALLEHEGVPLVVWILRRVEPLCQQQLLAGGTKNIPAAVHQSMPDVKVVTDAFPGAGPLAGLQAGLAAGSTDANLLLACDLPALDPKLVEFLLNHWQPERFDAVVPWVEERWQPLHALYHRR